jgi:hypothetical protein
MRQHHGHGVVLRKRQPSGQQLIQDDPDRIQVGGASQCVPSSLLRRHIGGGPQRRAGQRQRAAGGISGDAEICESGNAISANQDVLRLDVAMDDSRPMHSLQTAQHLNAKLDRLAHR